MWLDIPIAHVEMTFGESSRYSLSSDDDGDWLGLQSRTDHGGYINRGPNSRLFAIAMFHQLHCVATLRGALMHGLTEDDIPHVAHCVNYLRELFLCSADSTLEPGDFATRNYTMYRMGYTRVCRDWSAVYTAADLNYAQASWGGHHT